MEEGGRILRCELCLIQPDWFGGFHGVMGENFQVMLLV